MSQTLESVLVGLTMRGSDRGALVRSAQGEKKPAVCVIMTSKRALRELCKPLLTIAAKLGSAPADFGLQDINQKIRLPALFDICDKSPHGWCWGEFKFFKLEVTFALFCLSVEAVAKVCTAHGASCSLDPGRPAEGYEIDKVLDRTR